MEKDNLRRQSHEIINAINAVAVIASANAFNIKDKHDKKEPVSSFKKHVFIEAGKIGSHVIKLEKLIEKYLELKTKSSELDGLKGKWGAVISGIKKDLRDILDIGKSLGHEIDTQKLADMFMRIAEDANRLAEIAGEIKRE